MEGLSAYGGRRVECGTLPPGLNVSVARLARASLQPKNIRANVDTLQ
jgi:hypothetical protein